MVRKRRHKKVFECGCRGFGKYCHRCSFIYHKRSPRVEKSGAVRDSRSFAAFESRGRGHVIV
jgi:hypothetical protein